MSEIKTFSPGQSAEQEKRQRYFAQLEEKYHDQIEFLKRVGGMIEDWANVKEHCLTVTAAAEALCDALGLPENAKHEIARTSVIHDWYKRVTKGTDAALDFPRAKGADTDDTSELQSLFLKAGVNVDMLAVTTPAYLERGFIQKNTTFEERLLSYLDAIIDNDTIVPFAARLDKAAAGRWKWLAEDEAWKKKLEPILGPGANFFDGQKAQETATQEEIFGLLAERGVALDSPEQVPEFIKREIEKHYS